MFTQSKRKGKYDRFACLCEIRERECVCVRERWMGLLLLWLFVVEHHERPVGRNRNNAIRTGCRRKWEGREKN